MWLWTDFATVFILIAATYTLCNKP
jgi:hypothetical protein